MMRQAELGHASLRLLGPGFEEPDVYDVQFNGLAEIPTAVPKR